MVDRWALAVIIVAPLITASAPADLNPPVPELPASTRLPRWEAPDRTSTRITLPRDVTLVASYAMLRRPKCKENPATISCVENTALVIEERSGRARVWIQLRQEEATPPSSLILKANIAELPMGKTVDRSNIIICADVEIRARYTDVTVEQIFAAPPKAPPSASDSKNQEHPKVAPAPKVDAEMFHMALLAETNRSQITDGAACPALPQRS